MSPVRRLAPATPEPDAALLDRLASGDLSALGVLFDRYHQAVRSVALHGGTPSSEVDDVVQETFLRLVATAPRYDGREHAKPWILGTAWRVSSERRRSVARWLRALAGVAAEPESTHTSTPEDDGIARQRWAEFCARVAKLPEKLRAAYVLVEVHGLSGEEAARALEIPAATVWTRLHYARKQLFADGAKGAAR